MYIDPNKLYGGPPVSQQRDFDKEHREQREDHRNMLDMGKDILDTLAEVKDRLELKEYMNSHEVCDFLRIKPSLLYVMKRKYNLPCHKPTGKNLYFVRSEVKNWMKTSEAAIIRIQANAQL